MPANENAIAAIEVRPHRSRPGCWSLVYPITSVWIDVTFTSKQEAEHALDLLMRAGLA